MTINFITDKSSEAQRKPTIGESKSDFPHTQADNGKARRLLGWNPKVGLDEGLRLFVTWLKSNSATLVSERL